MLDRVTDPPPSSKPDLGGVRPPTTAVFVKAAWLQECLRTRRLLPTAPYEMPRRPSAQPGLQRADTHTQQADTHAHRKHNHSDSSGQPPAKAPKLTPAARPSSPAATPAHHTHPHTHAASAAEARLADANALAEAAVRRAMASGKLSIGASHTRYYCYNCGSASHGAIGCPRPPRGSPANTYVPPIAGARSRIEDTWVCARPHPLDKATHPNAAIIKPFEDLLEGYEASAKDKVRRAVFLGPAHFSAPTVRPATPFLQPPPLRSADQRVPRGADAEDHLLAAPDPAADPLRGGC